MHWIAGTLYFDVDYLLVAVVFGVLLGLLVGKWVDNLDRRARRFHPRKES